jgi:hypothetical protein
MFGNQLEPKRTAEIRWTCWYEPSFAGSESTAGFLCEPLHLSRMQGVRDELAAAPNRDPKRAMPWPSKTGMRPLRVNACAADVQPIVKRQLQGLAQ